MKDQSMQPYLLTAGGKIQCLRCTAKSSRSKQQCGRPALKSSTTQKCQFHGGRHSGPQSEAGKARIAKAKTTHGQETRAARAARSAALAKLSQLEDALHVLGMTEAPRSRGRKALGYTPLTTIEDVRAMLLDEIKHRNFGGA